MLGQLATHWLTLGNDQMLRSGKFDRRMSFESFNKTDFHPVLQQRALRR